MVLSQTKGRGVNFVLNSQGDSTHLETSLRCLSPKGHFLEIGNLDIDKNNKLPLQLLQKEIHFHGIVLDKCLEDNNTCRMLSNLLSEAISKGIVKPLPREVFSEKEIISAFQFMATGRHVGKILIKLDDNASSKTDLLPCFPRYD